MRTLIGAFVVFAAVPLLAQTATPTEVDAIRAVLRTQERGVRLSPNKVILVSGATSAFALPKPVADDIRDDYTSKNEKSVELKQISGTQLPLRVADVSAFRIPTGYDWPKLAAKYPDADLVVDFSRPGFDRAQWSESRSAAQRSRRRTSTSCGCATGGGRWSS